MNRFCARDTLKSLVWTFSRTLKYCSIVEGSCGVVTCWYSDHANLIFRILQILNPPYTETNRSQSPLFSSLPPHSLSPSYFLYTSVLFSPAPKYELETPPT
jgi:hypothetical protein